MIRILTFLLILSTLLGPKIYFVDLSVFFGMLFLGVIFLISPNRNSIDLKIFENTLLLIVYFVYVLAIQIVNGVESADIVLRTIRSIAISIIILSSSIFLVKNGKLIMPILMFILLTHASLIIIAAHNIDLNLFLGEIFGNNKIRGARSSGLVAGFDIAGFFCIAGLLAIATGAYSIKSSILKYMLAIIFTTACYYSSRVSMAISLIILLYMVLKFIFFDRSVKLINKLIISVVFVPIFIYVSYEIILIFEVALNMGIISVTRGQELAVIERFSSGTLEEAGLLGMYFLPTEWESLLFGSGANVPTSDVGYVKLIYWHGILGVGLLILIHAHLFGHTIANLKHGVQARRERIFIIGVYAMTFALTFKNNYLLTRGVWSLLLLFFLHSLWRNRNSAAEGRLNVERPSNIGVMKRSLSLLGKIKPIA